jgi:hypothetical protein
MITERYLRGLEDRSNQPGHESEISSNSFPKYTNQRQVVGHNKKRNCQGSLWRRQSQQSFNTLTSFNFLLTHYMFRPLRTILKWDIQLDIISVFYLWVLHPVAYLSNWFFMTPSIATKFQYINSPFFILLHSLYVSAPTGHLQVRYTIRCF